MGATARDEGDATNGRGQARWNSRRAGAAVLG